MAVKFKKGDRVMVIAGEQRPRKGADGKKKPVIGEILKVFTEENRVIVSGVNMVKRHTKQSARSQGGIINKEAPIQMSKFELIHEPGKIPWIGCGSMRASASLTVAATKLSSSEIKR